jgi:hypothetical protein
MADFAGKVPGGQWIDKCTEHARQWERKPSNHRAWELNPRKQAQHWRDVRWSMWDSGPKS